VVDKAQRLNGECIELLRHVGGRARGDRADPAVERQVRVSDDDKIVSGTPPGRSAGASDTGVVDHECLGSAGEFVGERVSPWVCRESCDPDIADLDDGVDVAGSQ